MMILLPSSLRERRVIKESMGSVSGLRIYVYMKYLKKYIRKEHGGFTPPIFGTNGGMVAEYFMFVKALARKLSKNRNEELHVTMCWLRTKISFLCRRAASCHSMSEAEGSKTPCYR